MPQVRVLLFGLKDKAVSKTHLVQDIELGATVEDVWLRLQIPEREGGTGGHADRRTLLVLVNGEPIDYLDGWKTELSDNDQVTYLRRTVGG